MREVPPTPAEQLDFCASAGLSTPDASVVAVGLKNSLDGSAGPIVDTALVVSDGAIFFEIVDVAVRWEF